MALSQVEQAWKRLTKKYSLSAETVGKLQWYVAELVDWNKRMNLTAIRDVATIISHHLDDSLALSRVLPLKDGQMVADVGSGAGLPLLPLKIAFPHIHGILIEVAAKRVAFLQHIIDHLELDNMETCSDDWRTFLRKTAYPVDVVIARASLKPEELIRMFKPSSPYKAATLVYWASSQWKPSAIVAPHIVNDESYAIDHKTRRLIVMRSVA